MVMKIRLDTAGLRALIKDNPELEIEIGKEVLNNVRDDVIAGKVMTQIDACLRGMVVQTGHWPAKYEAKSPELIAVVNAATKQIVEELVTKRLDGIIESRITAHLGTQRTVDTRALKEQLKELLTPEMARELLREKILL